MCVFPELWESDFQMQLRYFEVYSVTLTIEAQFFLLDGSICSETG